MWRSALVALAMICALLSAGCVERQNLALHTATVHGANQQGVVINIFVEVNNPNDVGVRVRNVRANVTMAQRYALPAIQYDANQFVPANKSGLIIVPAVIPWAVLRPMLRETARQTNIDYVIVGQVDITAFRLQGMQVNQFYINDRGGVSHAHLLAAAQRTAWH